MRQGISRRHGQWGVALALCVAFASGAMASAATGKAAEGKAPKPASGAAVSAMPAALPPPHPEIAEFLPQGAVSGVEAVQLRFAASAVAFGDAGATAPLQLTCEGPAPQGRGRWLDDARWTYVFDATLPAGVRCVASPNPDFRSLHGQALPSGLSYEFNTGAPSFVDARPYQGIDIDEEQVFILRFDAPVDARSVAENSHCVVQGLGERIPMAAVSDEHRIPLMEAAYLPQPDDLSTVALLRCARVLPPQAQVRVEVGPGVRALGQPAGLPGTQQPQVLEYEVRPAFMARMSCSRERAERPCLPITPISVTFTAPVPKQALVDMRLSAGDTVFQPDADSDDDDFISYVNYPGPFPAGGKLTLALPEGLLDDAGRPLENADRFPLEIPVADYPPLAKFASGAFGVIERFAHDLPGALHTEPAAVPVTLRHVESDLGARGLAWSAGQVASLRSIDDAEVLRWYARLQRLDTGSWTSGQLQDILADREPRGDEGTEEGAKAPPRIDVRGVSLLKDNPGARRMSLPSAPADQPRPFEVVGVPLLQSGFHLLEIESPRLGASLLEDGQPMYVRTGVLLTNLSLHLKQGRDDLLVWVTTLADAAPVADAEITVLDCNGRQLASGRSDAQGLWHHLAAIEAPRYCSDTGLDGLFVSARIPADHPQAYGEPDYAFVLSDWNGGIETWRFNVPTSFSDEPDRLAHTVFDRSLFRAGETVSMKHYLRVATRDGLGVPEDARPDLLLIEHEGSSQSHELPVEWLETPSGGLVALSEFEIPPSANLGAYSVRLTDGEQGWYGSTRFRVEEFRLPILAGRLSVKSDARPGTLVAPGRVALDVQLAWLSGGPAAGQKISLSAVAEDRWVSVEAYEDYSFAPPSRWPLPPPDGVSVVDAQGDEQDGGSRRELFLDNRELVLDADGTGSVDIETAPDVERPMRFQFEASFADPNGEIQTLSQSAEVWPAEVQAGLKTESWGRAGQEVPVQLIALGTDLRPRAGVAMSLLAVERKMNTVRKRMVGGFYRYDSHTERKLLGTLCEGVTAADGTLACAARIDQAGSFDLVAVATDDQGRASHAQTSVWVAGAGELWFGGDDDDRIDLIPAKREWAVGEQAEFQVRMPFREALALVSVEREGVLWTEQVRLAGKDPLIRIPVAPEWGPNAYVSALVLRGRLYEAPGESFAEPGGQRNPGEALITSRIDLAKPAFRLGLAELRISGDADRLRVEITPDQDILQVRDKAGANIKVSLPDGSPAAHGTVAFAVVDEALLELAPNDSWLLYEAMHPRRSLSVNTATSQMEVVGRRHYGRKAVAAGGGGGSLPTRQLFDTLLSWQPMVQLDANGEAHVDFTMNDSLSLFRLVAVADHGAGLFGMGSAAIVSRQDLQLVSGLPPVVREGDSYQAQVTLRNATEQARDIEVKAAQSMNGRRESLEPRSVRLAGGASATVSWTVAVPDLSWPDESGTLEWRFEAGDDAISDSVAVTQRIEPHLPVTTVQASLLGLRAGESAELPVAAPVGAQGVDGKAFGGLALEVGSSLAGSQQAVLDWWRAYPYTCLEQSASQAIALNDADGWEKVVARLVTHMDGDGMLRYFPGTGPGSEVLTAYLVAASDDALSLGLDFSLPRDALDRMLDGLQAFAEGRLKREAHGAEASLDSRRIMAMEALSRHGRADRAMLASLASSPEQWPTPTVVDWLSLLTRLPEHKDSKKQMAQARSILVGRMTVSGAAMVFSDTALNAAPGLMASRATSQARLMLAVAGKPQWRDDLPRMAQGLVGLQAGGTWRMTTENLLGLLALTSHARHFEAKPATGVVRATLGAHKTGLAVPPKEQTATARLGWPQANDAALLLKHEGQGRAWVSLRAQARLPAAEARNAGYRIERRIVPVRQARPQAWSRGDIYRVELDIHSRDSSSWVVLNDPVPAGATILGSGLGRDSTAFSQDDDGLYSPAFVERTASTYRAYFDYLPAGKVRVSYTVRLSAAGDFVLPPTRVEALYRPDLYGSLPNADGLAVGSGDLDDTGQP